MGSPALRTSRTLLGCASDAFVSTYHGGDRARRAAWNIGRVHSHSGTGPPGDVGGKSSSFVRSLLAKQERRRHSFPTERAELLWNRCPGLPQKAGAPASSRAFQSRAISWSIVDRIKALHTIRAPGPVKEKIGFVGNTKELLNGAGSTIPSLRALRDGIRHLQAELREELHQVWESISEMAGATSESLIHMQEQLASYRGIIESKIQLELVPHRALAEERLVTMLCSLELDSPSRKMVVWSVPALLSEMWRRTDPAYVSPRLRLGIMPTSRLPKYLRDILEGGSWFEVHIRRPLLQALHEAAMVARAIMLSCLFSPVIFTAPISLGFNFGRDLWCRLLVWTLETAGPAFIKWGQWAAARPDLLPRDICDALSDLHSNARAHSFAETERAVREAFGRPLSYFFDEFEEQPVASGSIAQVHRAILSERGAAETGFPVGTMVAVKVRHPGVSEVMEKDFALMERIAGIIGSLKSLAWIRLDESVRQFGAPMREQLDLQGEARNLERFNANFRRWPDCCFPEPLRPLVTENVLVESFEYGESVLRFVDGSASVLQPNDPAEFPLRAHICSIGVNIFFKMILTDNFVHGDMHPGNVLVAGHPGRVRTWADRAVSGLTPWDPIAKVVMLDAGMAFSLSKSEQQEIVNFFQACIDLDGYRAGQAVLRMGRQTANDETQEGYLRAMGKYYGSLDEQTLKDQSSEVLANTMDLLRQYRINISGEVSALLVQMFVLEGWASRLDNEMRIMEILKMMLPTRWNMRMPPAVDRVMRNTTVTTR